MKWNKELQEYFKSLNVEVSLYPNNQKKKFTTIERFFSYYSAEMEFWNKQSNNFDEIKTHIKLIMNALYAALNESNMERTKVNIQTAVNLSKKNEYPHLPSSSLLAEYLINLADNNQTETVIPHLLNYLKEPKNISMHNNFQRGDNFGFLIQMILIINNNSNSSQKINSLVNKTEGFLSTAETDYQETKIRLQDDVETQKKQNDETTSEIEKWKGETQKKTEEFLTHKEESLNELEKLYNEKLKLSEPAAYWKKYSDKKVVSGRIWLGSSIAVGTIIIIFSTCLLIHLPGLFRENNVLQWENVIRWSVLSALIYSSFFYILRLLVKMTLSSYHLATDAQERHQLTFQYLSLLKAKAIEEKDKEIILQSLFSRADTGLLKGDSSPTMPDGLLSQIVKNIGGG